MLTVAHNLFAMNTQRQFNINTKSKSSALEKLGSGYRINKAADNAAGLCISEQMRGQIRGLDKASENCQNGVSLCQIADGALSEVDELLHRITELSVQSSNDTNTEEDRKAIQYEIEQILHEIDHIGETTNYNDKKIFDGKEYAFFREVDYSTAKSELLNGTYFLRSEDIKDEAGNIIMTKEVANSISAAMSNFVIGTSMRQQYSDGSLRYDGTNGLGTQAIQEGNIKILKNSQVLTGIINAPDADDYNNYMGQAINAMSLYQNRVIPWDNYDPNTAGGAAIDVLKYCGLADSSAYNGTNGTRLNPATSMLYTGYYSAYAAYAMAVHYDITMNGNYHNPGAAWYINTGTLDNMDRTKDLSKTALSQLLDGYVTIQDSVLYNKTIASNDIQSMVETYQYLNTLPKSVAANNGDINLQVGSDSNEGLLIQIDSMNTTELGINGLDVSTRNNAEHALTITEHALDKVSSIRSSIGAYQNRLQHIISNIDNAAESLTSAETAIRDTDMADEMVRYSKYNILENAAQALMAQNNQNSQGILRLLQ
jgi:flagellin